MQGIILCEHMNKKISPEQLGNYFNTLITPPQKPFITEEKEELLKIAVEISKKPSLKALFKKSLEQINKEITKHPSLNKKIERHVERYNWVPYNYGSYLFTKEYFLEELKDFVNNNTVLEELRKIERTYENLKERQNKIAKELNIDTYHQKLFDALRWNSFIIDYKKKIFTISHFYFNYSLMKEIAVRLGIEQRLAHCLLESEMKAALLHGKMVPMDVLEERYRRSVVFIHNGKLKLMTGKEAIRFLEERGIREEKALVVNEIKGQIANRGKVRGKVKIIPGTADFHKFKKGEILVTYMTTPEFVPILKKAAAIVTNEGGITCHAAIVSRELGIPCIIGTKTATRDLHDNDFVEVDANSGIVKVIKKANQ